MNQISKAPKGKQITALGASVGLPTLLWVLQLLVPDNEYLAPLAIGATFAGILTAICMILIQPDQTVVVQNMEGPCGHVFETFAETRARIQQLRDLTARELAEERKSELNSRLGFQEYGEPSSAISEQYHRDEAARLDDRLAEIKADLSELSPETHAQFRLVRNQ